MPGAPFKALDCGYEFINAKVRARRSYVYEDERLDNLCRCRNLFDLIATLFPGQEFADHIALQRALVARHVEELAGLVKYLNRRHAVFYRSLLERYVVENVKVALRALERTGNVASGAAHMVPLPADLHPTVTELLALERREDLPGLFGDEALVKAANTGLGHAGRAGNVFYLEASLDSALHESLHERASIFKGEVRRKMRLLIDAEIAVYNTMFLIRAKSTFGLAFEAIRDFLVATEETPPGAYASLMHVEDMNEMARRIPNGMLRQAAGPIMQTPYDLEAQLWRRIFRESNRIFYASILDPAGLLAYTYIRRVELLNLLRLVEGLRYGMDGGGW